MHTPERRKYRRIRRRFLLSFKPIADEVWKEAYGSWDMRFMDNIGAGGLLFYSEDRLPIGALLELKLKLPISNNPIKCTGKVVRIETTPPSKIYRIAVVFVELVNQHKEGIEKLANEEEG